MTRPPIYTEPLMTAIRCDNGLEIGGKVRIQCLCGNVSNYWLSIEDQRGETHQIRVTRGGKVIVTATKRKRTPRIKRYKS